MSRTPSEHSGSVPDLTSENIPRRKRGYNDDFTEALDQFSNKMMAKLNEWKTEFSQELFYMKDSLNNLNETSKELKAEVNQIRGEYTAIQRSVQELDVKQNNMQTEVVSLQKSIQFHGDNQDELIKQMALCTKEIKSINIINTELANIKTQNRKLMSEINQREQRDRLLNVEIVGVPEHKDEDLTGIILQLGKHTSMDITREDIIHVNRVSSISKLQGRPT